jgi:hypothetical protein
MGCTPGSSVMWCFLDRSMAKLSYTCQRPTPLLWPAGRMQTNGSDTIWPDPAAILRAAASSPGSRSISSSAASVASVAWMERSGIRGTGTGESFLCDASHQRGLHPDLQPRRANTESALSMSAMARELGLSVSPVSRLIARADGQNSRPDPYPYPRRCRALLTIG